jgi:hypothetical protein
MKQLLQPPAMCWVGLWRQALTQDQTVSKINTGPLGQTTNFSPCCVEAAVVVGEGEEVVARADEKTTTMTAEVRRRVTAPGRAMTQRAADLVHLTCARVLSLVSYKIMPDGKNKGHTDPQHSGLLLMALPAIAARQMYDVAMITYSSEAELSYTS